MGAPSLLLLAGCGLFGVPSSSSSTVSRHGDPASASAIHVESHRLGHPGWYVDEDGDGWGSGAPVTRAVIGPAGYVTSAGDCDDGDASIHPGATEICDAVDDDCDRAIDGDDSDLAGLTCTWEDADGDGWGVDGTGSADATVAAGRALQPGDCDDADADVHPGAYGGDRLDGVDSDCDGQDADAVEVLDVRDVAATVVTGPQGVGFEIYDAGDLDGDGLSDVYARYLSGGAAVVSGAQLAGPSTSVSLTPWASAWPCVPAAAGDVDGDGLGDLWLPMDGACEVPSLVTGASLASGEPVALSAVPAAYVWRPVPDGDGDGAPDLGAVTSVGSVRSLALYASAARGALGSSDARATIQWGIERTSDSPWFLDAGDVDGDGRNDLLLAEFDASYAPYVYVLPADTSGDVPLADVTPVLAPRDGWNTGHPVAVGDVDGDGLADVVIGEGLWTGRPEAWASSGPTATRVGVAAGDVDGDGFADLLCDYGFTMSGVTSPMHVVYGPVEGDASASRSVALEVGLADGVDSDLRAYADALHVLPLADLDGDGFGELLVATPRWVVPDGYGDVWYEGDGTLWRVPGSAL